MRAPLRLALVAMLAYASVGCSTPTVRLKRVLNPRLSAALEKPMALEVDDNRAGLIARTVDKAADGAGKSLSERGPKGDVLGMISDGLEGAGDLGRAQPVHATAVAEPLRRFLGEALGRGEFRIAATGDAPVIIRAKPTDWSYSGARAADPGRGVLEVTLEIYEAGAKRPLRRYVFDGKARGRSELETMTLAAGPIAELFVERLQVRHTWRTVELDDGDEVVSPGIELCERGRTGEAFVFFNELVARAPESPAAHYNLALFEDAAGRYDRAEALVQRAIQLKRKPLYEGLLKRVRRAKAEAARVEREASPAS